MEENPAMAIRRTCRRSGTYFMQFFLRLGRRRDRRRWDSGTRRLRRWQRSSWRFMRDCGRIFHGTGIGFSAATFDPDFDVSPFELKLGDILFYQEFNKLSELFLIHEYSRFS